MKSNKNIKKRVLEGIIGGTLMLGASVCSPLGLMGISFATMGPTTYKQELNCSLENGFTEKDFKDKFASGEKNFSRCNFPYGTNFDNMDLTGTDFSLSKIEGSSFKNSILDLASFGFTKLKDSKFENSKGRKVDFYNANFSNSKFISSEFQESTFQGSTFDKKAEIVNSSFYNVNFNPLGIGALIKDSKFINSKFRPITNHCMELDNLKLDRTQFKIDYSKRLQVEESKEPYTKLLNYQRSDSKYLNCLGV